MTPDGKSARLSGVGLFGKREVKPAVELDGLDSEVRRIASVVRQLEVEQAAMHDQVRRWMRRAVAAERVVERTQADRESPAAAAPTSPQLNIRDLRGARGRRLARLLRSDPIESPEGGTNGVH